MSVAGTGGGSAVSGAWGRPVLHTGTADCDGAGCARRAVKPSRPRARRMNTLRKPDGVVVRSNDTSPLSSAIDMFSGTVCAVGHGRATARSGQPRPCRARDAWRHVRGTERARHSTCTVPGHGEQAAMAAGVARTSWTWMMALLRCQMSSCSGPRSRGRNQRARGAGAARETLPAGAWCARPRRAGAAAGGRRGTGAAAVQRAPIFGMRRLSHLHHFLGVYRKAAKEKLVPALRGGGRQRAPGVRGARGAVQHAAVRNGAAAAAGQARVQIKMCQGRRRREGRAGAGRLAHDAAGENGDTPAPRVPSWSCARARKAQASAARSGARAANQGASLARRGRFDPLPPQAIWGPTPTPTPRTRAIAVPRGKRGIFRHDTVAVEHSPDRDAARRRYRSVKVFLPTEDGKRGGREREI